MGLTLWQHIKYSVRHGAWEFGFLTRKKWPGKPQFGLFTSYYDGHHWAFHLGPFYIGASYY